MRSFADLPGLVEESLREHARVALVYFDAFGWRFCERHSGHALFRDATAERWRSQFPSTTTVHTTTLQTGLPVGEHGLYEWNLYEPRLDRLITPLWFSFAGDRERDTLLAAGLDPADVFPFPTLYERLEVPCHVVNPAEYAFSTPNRRLGAGATAHGYRSSEDGLRLLADALAGEERGYGMIHLPALDGLMHYEGPGAAAVDGLVDATLSEIAAAPWPEGTLVLLTADHGMAAISPERTSYVNVVWPELAGHLALGADGLPLAPAGSARDLFLHVLAERLDEVVAELGRRLAGRADVERVESLVEAGLFGASVSEALRARLANLVVLPHEGEAAWWFEPGRFEQRFHGQHGGLSADEIEIPLVSWVVA